MQMLHALNDRVIVEPEAEEEKKGSLYIARVGNDQTLPAFAKVYDIGPQASVRDNTGLAIRVGDRVAIPKYAGQRVELDDGTKLVVVAATEILALSVER